ncbi:leucine-rich repeat-containing serine/threonine-protein kinase [Enterovibrio sp. ZSDZ42]|uniref:Leucine-rich repeat-containing serine/threonine-protein kinase n=1 Tax=Enterovibrio gelatinilyticus TaxID=2899819 RepID=A0ABT5QYZ8_9GAMM|nr:leucine-rich repeat-containing protein kinase family protein [Enterovibrio sp. ZSDZ42]MDD1793233.1 leucine-rich repeat-containing serine/threonine-protein kinase [Enterovibrio sp. ZSDZ42]
MHSLSQLRSGELAGITRLKLSENLTSFPLEILSLADTLEILDLSDNQLSSLPQEIVQLRKLKILFASNNRFNVLPEVLGQCPELDMIGFKSNQISVVPENALPPKLRWLILTDNQIETLPDSLGLRPRMQKLALAGNRLNTLPKTMSELHNLELLRISANQLQDCPDHVFSLPKLAWFAFSGNPFCQSSENKSSNSIDSVPHVPSSSFTLQSVLGQGASGVISNAVWNNPQTEYPADIAVKVFKGEVTSDGYPQDELNACLKVGYHPSLVQPLAQVSEKNHLALVMNLIPPHFKNLGLPPNFDTCTRDTFPAGFTLSIAQIDKMVNQMEDVFNHMHDKQVCHGDLYAHNTLFDDESNIIFGDFGAASMYHMLSNEQQQNLRQIEHRALKFFIEDLLSVCREDDKLSDAFKRLQDAVAR